VLHASVLFAGSGTRSRSGLDQCPWCETPYAAGHTPRLPPTKPAGSEIMFAVIRKNPGERSLSFASDADGLAKLGHELALDGSAAYDMARASSGVRRRDAASAATALRALWVTKNSGPAVGVARYEDPKGAFLIGPAHVLFHHLGVVVLLQIAPTSCSELLPVAQLAVYEKLVGSVPPHPPATLRWWSYPGTEHCPGCNRPWDDKRTSHPPPHAGVITGVTKTKHVGLAAARHYDLVGSGTCATDASLLRSDPGATAQQLHMDQLTVVSDEANQSESAGIAIMALSEQGCSVDAELVDWEGKGDDDGPYAVIARARGDMIYMRYDLRHNGAANTSAVENYRLHFHIDSVSSYHARVPGTNHYKA